MNTYCRYMLAATLWAAAVAAIGFGFFLEFDRLMNVGLFLTGAGVAASVDVICRRERVRVQTLIELCRVRESETHAQGAVIRSVK